MRRLVFERRVFVLPRLRFLSLDARFKRCDDKRNGGGRELPQTHYDLKPDGETFAPITTRASYLRKYELLEVSDDVYEQLMDTNGDEDTPTTIEFKGEPDEEAGAVHEDENLRRETSGDVQHLVLGKMADAMDDGTIERDENGRKIAKTHRASVVALRFDGNRAKVGQIEDDVGEEVYVDEVVRRRRRRRRRRNDGRAARRRTGLIFYSQKCKRARWN